MSKKKVLITGAAGFIGSEMTKKLLQSAEYNVVAVDNLSTGNIENLDLNDSNLDFINCDVNNKNDVASIFYKFGFDYVFHYAALVGVFKTQQNPVKVLEDTEGIKNILNLSKNTKVKKIIFSSSSEVYGEPIVLPQNEKTTPLNSRLPYAVVKNLGEVYLKSYKKEYDLSYNIFRFFNTYGEKQSIDFVISKFINLAIKNKDITIYGDGNQTRTFCYIDDNIQATYNAIFDANYDNTIINIGSDQEIKIKDLAQLIITIAGSSSKIVHLPPLKEGDMSRRKPDIGIMKNILDRKFLSLELGLKKLIENKTEDKFEK